MEKRYQWSRKQFWDLICADRTISFTTACVSTVPNTSSGLTVHPKHVVGLRSCSLRKEHPTVSALKSTTISAHHKILTCACSVARRPQNCITVQLTVKPYHKISLNLTEPWRQVLSDIQTLEGEIYWNISKDTLYVTSLSVPVKLVNDKRQPWGKLDIFPSGYLRRKRPRECLMRVYDSSLVLSANIYQDKHGLGLKRKGISVFPR